MIMCEVYMVQKLKICQEYPLRFVIYFSYAAQYVLTSSDW